MHFTTVYRHAYLAIVPVLSMSLLGTEARGQVIAADDGVATFTETTDGRIDISGGQVSGDRTNLFHSFEQFDITAEQTANFITTDNIQNVVGRVDSHQASTINGTLQVSGSDANLYLMNPAGLLLGPDAQLNLSGGFTATTATGIGFSEEHDFAATGTANYSQLNGTPETFHFDAAQPGAVVNLAELSVDEHEAISLIGGTVVNAGKLSAPAGTVTVAAVEGESLVRISQGDQLLSLEVERSEGSWENTIAPTQIGEMLTGSGIAAASELITHADGTVSLSSTGAVIDETGGGATISGGLSTEGELGGNINVLGSQIEVSNATLDASGNVGGGLVRIGGDYLGEGAIATSTSTLIDSSSVIAANALEYGEGGTAIVWSDRNTRFDGSLEATSGIFGGDGGFVEVSGKEHLMFTGYVDVSAPEGINGNILLDPKHLVITDGPAPGNTTSTDYVSSAAVENLTGDVLFTARDGITIESLSNGELRFQNGTAVTFQADSDDDGIGAFSMDPTDWLTARSGSFEIYGAGVTLGTVNTDISGNSGGDITIGSSEEVTVNSISTNSFFGSGENDRGGNVNITANGGDIVIRNRIKAWSYSNEEGAGGDITLQSSGDIRIETPQSGFNALASQSRASSGNADVGGSITLSAPDGLVAIQGINSGSISDRGGAGDGGDIRITVGSIQISNISSRTRSREVAAQAGEISLIANDFIEVGRLLASGSGAGGIDNNISLTGNRIDLVGGSGSVQGATLALTAAHDTRSITLGQTTPANLRNPPDSSALNIWEQDLAAASEVDIINVGSRDNTGVVSLFESAITNPVPVDILGGRKLVGSSSDTLFEMIGPGTGNIGSSQITFSNIEQFDGGLGNNNSLSTNAAGALWTVTGENQGRLQVENSAIAAFQNISNIVGNAGRAPGEQAEHEVRFAIPAAAITGAIDVGDSDLTLVGDAITIGRREGDNNITGGTLLSTGRLSIRSASDGVSISLGGVESSEPATLSITNGELDAIQPGFQRLLSAIKM